MCSPLGSRVHRTGPSRGRLRGVARCASHRGAITACLVAFAAALPACSGETATPLSHDAAVSASTTPVAPPELVLGLRWSKPELLYNAFGSLAGKGLPRSLNVLLTTLVGLDPLISGRLVSGQDWLGVVTAEPPSRLGWALAVPVSSGRELAAELTLGSAAPLQANARVGWTELAGLNGGAALPGLRSGPLAAGISGNFLLVGSNATALAALAPWLRVAASHRALAPEQAEPGLSARLHGSGLALQALLAHGRHSAALSTLGGSDTGARVAAFAPLLAALADQLEHRASAYLGLVQSGDVHLRWQNDRLLLEGAFRATGAPTSGGGVSLCREVAALPDGVRVWFAGTEAQPSLAPAVQQPKPDWDSVPGDWQRTLLDGLAVLGSAVEDRVRVSSAGIGSGPWLLGWRVQRGQATALAILDGVSPGRIAAQPQSLTTPHAGRVQIATKDGRTVEWAWAKRGSGTMTAVGAALGDDWHSWSRSLANTAWPSGISPSECGHLLAAVGTGRAVLAGVFSSPEGLRIESDLPLATLGGVFP